MELEQRKPYTTNPYKDTAETLFQMGPFWNVKYLEDDIWKITTEVINDEKFSI